MNLKLAGLFVFLLLAPSSSPAQKSSRPWRTDNLENGRGWNLLPETAKVMYVDGVQSAFRTAFGYARSADCQAMSLKALAAYGPQGWRYEEMVKALDRFYAAPENLFITVMAAMAIVTAKAEGVSQSVIDERLAGLRRLALQAPERKPQGPSQ